MHKIIIALFFMLVELGNSNAQQQIVNGDFENTPVGEIAGSIDGWQFKSPGNGVQANFFIEESSGNKQLRVDIGALGSPEYPYNIAFQTASDSELSFKNGDVVNYSFYAQGQVDGQQLRLKLRDSNNGNSDLHVFTLTDQMKEYTFSSTYTATRSDYQLMFHLAYNTGSYWIDDVKIVAADDTSVKNYYVSTADGNDNNDGSESSPFKTIQKAANVIKAGETCYIKEGRYREAVSLSSKQGNEQDKITFQAYPGHQVVIDGTVDINQTWQVYSGNIYKTNFSTDIWQLFVNDNMVTSARWPNAKAWTDEMWDNENHWGHQSDDSSYGIMVDDGTLNLAGQTEDFTGAIAILNVGSWLSFAETVESHGGSSATFTYSTNFNEGQYHHKKTHGKYFFEASLACLDAPNEWYYNKASNELYLYAEDGQNPTGKSITGKRLTYGLSVSFSTHIVFKDIDFFACTFAVNNSTNCTIENSDVTFPSYSRRMLGEITKAAPTIVNAGSSILDSYNVIRNCAFQYADGTGMEIIGKNDTIDNCSFYQIDYSCVGSLHDVMVNARNANDLTFRYNTMSYGGNSVGIKMGLSNKIEYNLVSKQGGLQNDGAAIQADASESDGAVMTHNWVMNTVKYGLRFDSPWNSPAVYGTYGRMDYNVVWGSKPMIPKGDYHTIYNNTTFDNVGADISIFNDEAHGGVNVNTVVRNNIAGIISGSNSGANIPPAGIIESCWIGTEQTPQAEVSTQLNDATNRDFRPGKNSALIDEGMELSGVTDGFIGDAPDIGAYEFNDTHYWIPGRKEAYATHPIPLNSGISNSDTVDLMWRQGYNASSHRVYFGTSSVSVESATVSSPEYLGEFSNNIVSPGVLSANQTYYWRVDAVTPEGVSKGEVWSFTAGIDVNSSSTAIFAPKVQSTLKVTPNPTSGKLSVFITELHEQVINVYDMGGKLLAYVEPSMQEIVNVDLSHLNRGVYIVKYKERSAQVLKK
ncbi:T9SS type A sorting domain-containing protein [Carboxylicivirga marina]|uniref:Right-handed parallel beta-helix repeat-containing protein n=1 Tax=Carboxylicivirga marina TaxID=2800988 RepID=A0ABS1HJ56_9BACT|nr:T9SS type A sorting domain-containing protein [Carboxylicivirga marina]MBK3517500.1 right-handed parallel beta-helix repeat-containing protein [Carboxylicivirga marina]